MCESTIHCCEVHYVILLIYIEKQITKVMIDIKRLSALLLFDEDNVLIVLNNQIHVKINKNLNFYFPLNEIETKIKGII